MFIYIKRTGCYSSFLVFYLLVLVHGYGELVPNSSSHWARGRVLAVQYGIQVTIWVQTSHHTFVVPNCFDALNVFLFYLHFPKKKNKKKNEATRNMWVEQTVNVCHCWPSLLTSVLPKAPFLWLASLPSDFVMSAVSPNTLHYLWHPFVLVYM